MNALEKIDIGRMTVICIDFFSFLPGYIIIMNLDKIYDYVWIPVAPIDQLREYLRISRLYEWPGVGNHGVGNLVLQQSQQLFEILLPRTI